MSNLPTSKLNPLQRQRRCLRMAVAAALPLLGGCAWWSLWPLKPGALIATPSLEVAKRGERDVAEGPTPIDPSVFEIALWNPAPAPTQDHSAVADQPVAPPPPLNIQLIGIITDTIDGQPVQKAAIYDADADRLLIIADGQRLREHIVRVLPSGVVELVDGQTTRQYRLRPDRAERGST